MFGIIHFLKRLYCQINPPVSPKSPDSVRFGILGAAKIASQGLIIPAKSHPDVIVAAVAARDQKRAEAFARKHGIPVVHRNYDELIVDPSLDCIYIPLPNSLHYEWAVKALKAGKHVLLEKPSVSNATEAKSLFRHPILRKPDAPVLLEAFHYRFHPIWQTFLTLFDPEDIEAVEVKNWIVAGVIPRHDIRFKYDLSGGALMDFGTYSVNALRTIFANEPTAITSVNYRPMAPGYDQQIDEALDATFEFPNGGNATISVDMHAQGGYFFPTLTKRWPSFQNMLPLAIVKLRAKKEDTENGLEKWTRKCIVLNNYMASHLWHRLDIITTTEYRDPQQGGRTMKTEEKAESRKAYKWPADEDGRKGEEFWSTYRYQLEEFVNRVKQREGSGAWVDSEDSIRQMELIDATYVKAGLPVRPTSKTLETSES